MNGKNFFPLFFILIFIVILTLGCSGLRGSGDLTQTTKEARFSKGIFNTTIIVNGKETTQFSLTSRQPAEVGIHLKNIGPKEIKNLNIRAIGCVDFVGTEGSDASKGIIKAESLDKGENNYFAWSIRAPELGSSESFTCPLIFRACFEEESDGYMELVIVDEGFSEAPGTPSFYYEGGIFETEPNFGIFRVINDKKEDTFVGTLKVKNAGEGWVDYIGQPQDSELEIYKINEIKMNVEDKGKLSFTKVGELSKGNNPTKSGCPALISSDGKTLTLKSGCTTFKTGDKDNNYDYLLKMIGGEELNLRLTMTYPENPEKAENYESVNYVIDSGYCIDLASLNIKLSGR